MRPHTAGMPVIAFIATVLAGTLMGGNALAAQPVTPGPTQLIEQVFRADSGDACSYGYTRGQLVWHVERGQPGANAVEVRGSVLDRPIAPDPVLPCVDDGRFTSVTITTLSGGQVLDSGIRRADNGVEEYRFLFVPGTNSARIESVAVQVCRHALRSGPPVYCGATQRYRAPTPTQG